MFLNILNMGIKDQVYLMKVVKGQFMNVRQKTRHFSDERFHKKRITQINT